MSLRLFFCLRLSVILTALNPRNKSRKKILRTLLFGAHLRPEPPGQCVPGLEPWIKELLCILINHPGVDAIVETIKVSDGDLSLPDIAAAEIIDLIVL